MRIPSLALLLLLLFSNFSYAGSFRAVEVVAFTGEIAPGSNGATFTGFGGFSSNRNPVLNNFGQTAFLGKLDSGNGTHGIWSEGGGNGLALVARGEGTAPGTGGDIFFNTFFEVLLNDSGQTAFWSILNNNSTGSDNGIWSEGGGNGLALVARGGDAAPGGGSFLRVGSPALNNAGQTAFYGELNGGGRGIWSEGGGNGLALVAGPGDVAPGTNGDSFIGITTNFSAPAFNDLGQTAFSGILSSSSSTNSGIWSEGGGNGLALVAREGDVAPGASGDTYKSFDFADLRLNALGQIAYTGKLNSGDRGIWSDGGGNGLALVARSGDMAPGAGGDTFAAGFGPDPLFNDKGQTAFSWELNGGGRGIWSEGGGNGLALVAREGDAAPGTNGDTFVGFGRLVLNDEGQAAFTASLSSGAPGTSSIWAQDSSGTLALIARIGDLLDVDDGLATDFREISDLSFLGTFDQNQTSYFNNLGQLAFQATFTDGSRGVFISNAVAIPEPTSMVLAIGFLGATLLRNRR